MAQCSSAMEPEPTLFSPLCGMPMTTLSQSMSVILSMSAFMPGISVSQPSRPKRLAAVYLTTRTAHHACRHQFTPTRRTRQANLLKRAHQFHVTY